MTTCTTPVFIHGEETAQLLGIPYSESMFETVVSEELPDTVIAFCQGKEFHSADKIKFAPRLDKFIVRFRDYGLHDVVLFAVDEGTALCLLSELFNLELVACLDREHTRTETVWYNIGSSKQEDY